jgi:CHAT domain
VSEGDNELRLRVCADDMIRVEAAPTEPRPQDCEIALPKSVDDTRRQTLKVLIDMLAENRLRKESEFQVLGALLYSVLFENQIGEYLHKAVEENRAPYLRVVLQFEDDTKLAGWPWEYLYCPRIPGRPKGGYFLTQTKNLLLSRRLPTASFSSFRVELPPVTVLFVASRPLGEQLRWEQVLTKIESLSERASTSGDGGDRKDVRIRVFPLLPDPGDSDIPGSTYETFLETLESEQPHIIHFVGHGDFHGGQGRVMFMKKNGERRPITDKRLAEDIWAKGQSALKMVFIQACESGRSEPDALLDRYQAVSGIASNLAVAGVPAVVAMQYAIDQDFAEVFACAFYEALADSKTVDIAVHEARQAVVEAERLEQERRDEEGSEGSGAPAFALPVLYWRRPDAVFPSLEAGPSAAPEDIPPADDTPAPLESCVWCAAREDETTIGTDDYFCGKGHSVRCNAEDPRRPGGVCRWPVKTAEGTHCVRCGKPLQQVPLQREPEFKMEAAPAGRIKVPASERAQKADGI